MDDKLKKLLREIVLVFVLILICISIFLYNKFHPVFLNFKNINQITITTINNERNRMKEQEIVITEEEVINEILNTINHKFFYNSECVQCLCKVPDFGTYKIKIGNSKYEIVIPHYTSDTLPYTKAKMTKVGTIKIPNEFILKITQILPPIRLYNN